MKTYFPNYFKRIGILFVFIAIVLSFIGGADDFRRGFNEGYDASKTQRDPNYTHERDEFKPYFTKEEANAFTYSSLFLSIVGFVLYLFSKEKIEDEFYQLLRSKSLIQALLFTWLFVGVFYVFGPDFRPEGFHILQLHLIFYILIFIYNKKYRYSD
ncbi:hypothetical protein [Labilibaculum sp.]|uniref:hypothetical protein n=1 Tax=Labilibaculum sp. TaxID=2060723 RepID=UPI00356A7BE3